MAVITNAGLNLLAGALQTTGAPAPAITFVDVVPGCGTLSVGLTNGNLYSTLSLNVGLPVALGAGQGLTITDGVNVQTVTVAAGGAALNATSIPVNGFTSGATFAATTTGVTLTPAVGDVALYNGSAAGVRISANAGVAGANPGESLNNAYFDGTQPTNIYMSVGYFGGSTATSTPGTGTLIAEDAQYWNHTLNADSASFQLDSTI